MITFKQCAVEKGITFVTGVCSSGRRLLFEYRSENGRTIAEITAKDKFERSTPPNMREVRIVAKEYLDIPDFDYEYSGNRLRVTLTQLAKDEVTNKAV